MGGLLEGLDLNRTVNPNENAVRFYLPYVPCKIIFYIAFINNIIIIIQWKEFV